MRAFLALPEVARVPRQSSVELDAPPELLILVADELDDLVVWRDLLVDAERDRPGVGLGVLEGDVDFQFAVSGAAEALDEFRLLRVRAAAHVEPSVVGARLRSPQVVRLDHERVAFPSAYGVPVPERLDTTLSGERTPVEIDVAKAV